MSREPLTVKKPSTAPGAPITGATAVGLIVVCELELGLPPGTPPDQLPAVNQSDETAPVQVVWARAGDAERTATTPTIAVVLRKAARPAVPGYGPSDDRFGLDNLVISKSRTFDHRCRRIAQ